LLRKGTPPSLGETHDAADLGDDIGITRVSGGITADCGTGALTVRRSVERLLGQGRLGTLRWINGDGTVAQLAVTIFDDDGRGVLRVQPTHADNGIRPGLSGSLLMVDGVAIGMLLRVDTGKGIGKVARIDLLMAKVDAYLLGGQGGAAALLDPSSGSVTAPQSSGDRLRVLAWSELPLDESSRAVNLTASDDSPPWASKPTRWPVSIDLGAGAGDTITVAGIVLDGRGVRDLGRLPAQVEISMNLSGRPRGWRSVISQRIAFRDGVAEIGIAPSRARLVRLSFGEPADGGDVISLGRVRLLMD
jgi:hypothetical protein